MSLEAYDTIFQQFPEISPEEWKQKIIKDLKGDEFDKLIWHSKEEIEVLPFYTKEDNQKYQLSIPEKESKSWLITEKIIVDDVVLSNKNALTCLQQGADSIVFDLQNKSLNIDEIELLIKDILIDIAQVYFTNYVKENKDILESIVYNSCPSTIKIPQLNSIVDELVYALINATSTKIIPTHFHFYTTQNYFFEMAKLRAFRWLWKQICDLKSIENSIFIQSETSLYLRNDQDEYTNMLRNTTEAMSAILGGCDSLIINSHDVVNDNTNFGKRIARNIHHVLKHESYFAEIKDATTGSYYIEYLTYQLAKKSWQQFSKDA